jgi:hypothetical protein
VAQGVGPEFKPQHCKNIYIYTYRLEDKQVGKKNRAGERGTRGNSMWKRPEAQVPGVLRDWKEAAQQS